MATNNNVLVGLNPGKTSILVSYTHTEAGQDILPFSATTDKVALRLVITSITGSLTVALQDILDGLSSTPIVSSVGTLGPYTAPLVGPTEVTPILLGNGQLVISYTGPVSYKVYARAISSTDSALTDTSSIDATIDTGKTNPVILNVSVPANQETQIPLPSGLKEFTLKTRTLSTLKVSFSAGGTTTSYLTLPTGATYQEMNISGGTSVNALYVQPGQATIVEVVAWTE